MTEAEIQVVYVEDDERLARLTTQYLNSHGIVVSHVARGDLAVAEALRLRPDVVLLDLMLPGIDGLEVCRRLRARCDVSIIMLTSRTEEADRVIGLEGGADDYISKPFQSRELLARIRSQVRRRRGHAGPNTERVEVGGIVIDPSRMQVTVQGKTIELTTNEFHVLQAFAQSAGRVIGREQLLQIVHGTDSDAFDRSIDVVVSRLRQKIETDPRNPQLIKTVRGAGYILAVGEGS
jgi:two-component system, OmpR family, response regulator